MSMGSRRALAQLPVLAVALLSMAACSSHAERRPQWAGGLPLTADVNGDGIEDLIPYGSAYGLAALDGRTYKPLWKRKGLDVAVHDARRLDAVAGRTLVMAPANTNERSLLLLDLSDGRTRATVPLSDKVASLCSAGDRVWVVQIDQKRGLLDPATGKLDLAAPVPAECAPRPGLSYACEHSAARCSPAPGAPSSLSMRLEDGTSAVTVEIKDPGTPEVTLVLADGKRVLFDREGARVDAADLAAGQLFLKRSGEVTAIDAATGAPMWSIGCSGNRPYLRATATRVYLECDGSRNYKALRVLDHSGKVLTDLGEPRS
jgi:outer membrane protein assembly factor BamB